MNVISRNTSQGRFSVPSCSGHSPDPSPELHIYIYFMKGEASFALFPAKVWWEEVERQQEEPQQGLPCSRQER